MQFGFLPFAVILFYHNVLFSILMPNILIGVLCHCKSYTFLFVGNCDEWATSYNQQTSTIEYLYGINYSTPYHRLGQRRNYRFVLKPNYFRKQRFSSSHSLTWSKYSKWPWITQQASSLSLMHETSFSSTPWPFWICILYLRYTDASLSLPQACF